MTMGEKQHILESGGGGGPSYVGHLPKKREQVVKGNSDGVSMLLNSRFNEDFV